MYQSNEILYVIVLTFLLFNGIFVRAFNKADPKFQSVRKGSGGTKKSYEFDYETPETVPDTNDFNNTVPGVPPEADDMEIDPREIFGRPLPYPILYASHANSVQSPQDHYPDFFPESDPYPLSYHQQYYPSVHPYTATVDPYASEEDIRYISAAPEMPPLYKPMPYNYAYQPYQANTPIPYEPSTVPDVSSQTSAVTSNSVVLPSEPESSNSVQLPTEIQDYMVKKIMQIVSEFENANKTQTNDHAASRDDTYVRPKNGSTLIATATIEENNITHVERDDTKTEIHSGGNRTETAEIVRVPAVAGLADDASTAAPERYVIEQFLDQNGNPCTKEVVVTSKKKTYYVYTCEEKGVPQTTTAHPNVDHYRDELKTNIRDTTIETKTEEPAGTTPMSADQTFSETLNDYAAFNKHE